MDFFKFLSMIGGLCLFLLGMNIMSTYLEKKSGGKLKSILGKLTDNPIKGFLIGLGVTTVIQSSSATTVMVVGLVSSGMMTLHESISIIMGANVGTTVTAWILSLTGIQSDNIWINFLKPVNFTPVLALIGIVFYMFCKNKKKQDTGMILLGFFVLMTGMHTMSAAVSGLSAVPEFRNIFLMFSNPILGIIAGALLTAIIQSSSASVGILQALCTTGAVTYASALPIIMGQNIGTCVTALISSVGASKDAKRAAMVHLYFNLIGVTIVVAGFYSLNAFFNFNFLSMQSNEIGIAIVHSAFNIICTVIMLPCSRLLEKLACLSIHDSKENQELSMLSDSLLLTPALAVERCRNTAANMCDISFDVTKKAMSMFGNYDQKLAIQVREGEEQADKYEDRLGSYLVKIFACPMTDDDSHETSKMMRLIGDFERISDHAVNILESVEEMTDKNIIFTGDASKEINVMCNAVSEILDLAKKSFEDDDMDAAMRVEPLEQVVDMLREQIKLNHTLRLQKNECTIEHGFVLSDILTNLERISDHCSNIAGCMLEMSKHKAMDMHEYLNTVKESGSNYDIKYKEYRRKYTIS